MDGLHGLWSEGFEWNVLPAALKLVPSLANGHAASGAELSASVAGMRRLRTTISIFSRTERWEAPALHSLWARDRLAMWLVPPDVIGTKCSMVTVSISVAFPQKTQAHPSRRARERIKLARFGSRFPRALARQGVPSGKRDTLPRRHPTNA